MLTNRKLMTAIAAIGLAGCLSACESSGLGDGGMQPEAAEGSKQFDPEIYDAARQAEAKNNYLEAARHYQSLLARDSQNLELAVSLARNLRYGGSGQQAAEVINALIAREGRTGPLLAELGKAYVSADQMNIAMPILQEAAGVAPDRWDVQAALGVAYDYEGRFDDAQKAYGAALVLSPQNPDVLNNMALSQAQAGDIEGAIATMTQAVDQPSASPQVRQNMALLLAFQGDVDGADRWARKDLPREIADENAKYYRYLAGTE
jgi:Flp pilus assembly protein TadD